MNQILITRIADNKTFSEESLAELLRDEERYAFENDHELTKLKYQNREWGIVYRRVQTATCFWPLDPAKYKISFANSLDIERVREMIGGVRDVLDSYEQRFRYDTRAISAIDAVRSLKVDFDSIASKYV